MAKGGVERLRRGVKTALFVVTMLASLLVLSMPVLVAVGDVAVSLLLAARFACGRCYGVREHLVRYGFRSSLMDIPLVSVARSIIITCVYSLCDSPGLSHGPYLGMVTFCSLASILILSVKACVFTPISEVEPEVSPSLARHKRSWGMPVLFLSSLVFALGHVVIAYRASCRARRKLLFHRVDPESGLSCKNLFSVHNKIPRSPTPTGKGTKSDGETRRKAINHDEGDLPVSLLADADSLFILCQGLTLHYKLSLSESPLSRSLTSSPFSEASPNRSPYCSPSSISTGRLVLERPLTPKIHYHHNRSFSNQVPTSALYAPLLSDSAALSSTFFLDEIPALKLDETDSDAELSNLVSSSTDVEEKGKLAVVLVHGFGGGVFSWRHIMGALARQIGCTVVAFDRPGWGLTSRPRRKDWEEKNLPNPYKIESQVDLLISFCMEMGFSSVVLVGHDDGGILALKAAEKILASDSSHVEIKGVVLLGASLSREVVPAFARILLHTSLGKKHMVRPLLRSEITQVINRHAWYDVTKLTREVMNFYKAPLYVEGWDEALHEIGRLSYATVLSPHDAAALLKSIEELPVLVVAGAEDALVSLKSAQAMASKLVNSRLVAISGCGHLPQEECPKALLAALSPFISRLFSPSDVLQRQ